MTLQEWCDKYNVGARPFEKEGYDRMMTVRDHTMTPDQSWDLFHLDDHVVTANSGGTIWLATRRIPIGA